jgi:hypothetical protein
MVYALEMASRTLLAHAPRRLRLDLNGTIFQHSGDQQGAKHGSKPSPSCPPIGSCAPYRPIPVFSKNSLLTLQHQSWSAPREFIAIREKKRAVGRRLIDVDDYIFRVFVANRQGDDAELWRDYKQHVEELKNDLQADGFCMKEFCAAESAFLSVFFTCNLLSPYLHASAPERRKSGGKRPPLCVRSSSLGCNIKDSKPLTRALHPPKLGGATSTNQCWTTFHNGL